GRCDAVPAECVQVGGEPLRLVEPAPGDRVPRLPPDDLAVDLALPEHLEGLPLGVVIDAREGNQRAFTGFPWRPCALDEIEALAHSRDLAGFRYGLHSAPLFTERRRNLGSPGQGRSWQPPDAGSRGPALSQEPRSRFLCAKFSAKRSWEPRRSP